MIEFRSVRKTYRDGSVAVAFFSLVDPSHRAVLLHGSSGSVLIDGQDVRGLDPVRLRRSIGYVLQAGGLLPHRTVLDNVATVPVLQGVPRRQARTAALGLLERVGLDAGLAGRYPAQLSGGQQQRVGVARALAADPNILLMDEPFGAVDPIVRAELQNELRRLQSELGKTMVFVTHDVDEAFTLGDEVVILKAGAEVAQVGPPAQILARPADDFVADFIGATHGRRLLRTVEVDGRQVVVDGNGRPAGVLAP